jgi:hypothetical protein
MKRRGLLKRALLSAAVLIAAGLGGLALYVDRALSAPDLKPRIEKAATEFLGRPATLDSLAWRRGLGALVGGGFRVYDDEARTRLLVDCPVVEAHIALLSLFKLAAGVTELRFVAPRVFLRRDAEGEWNAARLVHGIASRPEEGGRHWGKLAFNWFTIAGGTVTVEDAAGELGALPPLAVDGSGRLRLVRRRADFPFTLEAHPEGSRASLVVSGSLGGRWRLRAELKNARAELAGAFWPPARRWTGRVSGSLEHDERAGSGWSVKARAAPLFLSTAAPRIELLAVSGEYRPGAAAPFDVVLRSSATDIEAKGILGAKTVEAVVASTETDVAVLLALAGALDSPGARPAARADPRSPRRSAAAASPPRRLRARLSADHLRWAGLDVRAARAVVTRSTGAYAIDGASFSLLGGAVSGSGTFLPGGGDAALGLTWTASGLDLAQVFRAAGSSHEAMGTLASTGQIATGAGDRFLPAMSGKVTLDLQNGWFGGLPGLLKVLARFNLSTLFAEAAGHHRARIPFDEARCSLTLAAGKATTDRPLVLKNKTLLIGYLGSLELPTKTLDGRVMVQVLTVTDEIVKLIPGLRDILLGRAKSMTPVWARVKGKASDPDVDVMQGKTITAPFWRAFQRIIKLPEKLGKQLGL